LKQLILAIVIDGEGRPVCTEMLPGNTADARVLVPIVESARALSCRPGVRRRRHGIISAATITALGIA
jgi:hypothetical protein